MLAAAATVTARRKTTDRTQVRRVTLAGFKFEFPAFFGPADDEIGAGGAPAALDPDAQARIPPVNVRQIGFFVDQVGRQEAVSRNARRVISKF